MTGYHSRYYASTQRGNVIRNVMNMYDGKLYTSASLTDLLSRSSLRSVRMKILLGPGLLKSWFCFCILKRSYDSCATRLICLLYSFLQSYNLMYVIRVGELNISGSHCNYDAHLVCSARKGRKSDCWGNRNNYI